MRNPKGLRHSIRKPENNIYLRRIAPVQDVFSSAQGRYFLKACKEKVKPQIGLAARKFGRRWGERSAAQISHHKVPA